jgi:two-component sensor histidine kinase
MQDTDNIRPVLDALGEPALVIDPSGRIALANAAATECLGPHPPPLPDLSDSPAALRDYLLRCAGVSQPLPGAATLRTADGRPVRFRTACCALRPASPGEARMLLLRLAPGGDARFATLAAKVDELNVEIRERRRSQMRLEAAVRERELLLRELHHRVKNNIHLLTGILLTARREATAQDAGKILEEVTQRLAAVAAVHQMLHLEGSVAHVKGSDFIAKVAGQVLQASGCLHRLELDVQEAVLSNEVAVPLALILNELLTNVARHAASPQGPPLAVRIRLATVPDGQMELAVADNGPGFRLETLALRRGSGLGLVQGLARQIGGSLATRPDDHGGMECIVRFHDFVSHPPAARRGINGATSAE